MNFPHERPRYSHMGQEKDKFLLISLLFFIAIVSARLQAPPPETRGGTQTEPDQPVHVAVSRNPCDIVFCPLIAVQACPSGQISVPDTHAQKHGKNCCGRKCIPVPHPCKNVVCPLVVTRCPSGQLSAPDTTAIKNGNCCQRICAKPFEG